jgi:hypothetical protein
MVIIDVLLGRDEINRVEINIFTGAADLSMDYIGRHYGLLLFLFQRRWTTHLIIFFVRDNNLLLFLPQDGANGFRLSPHSSPGGLIPIGDSA